MNLNLMSNDEANQPTIPKDQTPQLDAAEVKTDNFNTVETLLGQMQGTLHSIKEIKNQQGAITAKVQELIALLAEAQAEETKLSETTLDLEIKWQELTQEFKKFSELNVSCD